MKLSIARLLSTELEDCGPSTSSSASNNILAVACSAIDSTTTRAPLPTALLRPHPTCPFFVAWNNVLVFVYDGFPPSFVEAKRRLSNAIPTLKKEGFGSMWPKTTLAAEQDGMSDLTLEELSLLKQICQRHSDAIIQEANNGQDGGVASQVEIPVTSLSVVQYDQRSLERLRARADIRLLPSDDNTPRREDGDEHFTSPSTEEKSRVDGVVAEWSNLPTYLPKVNAPGSRINSYRPDDESGRGYTCVSFLEPSHSLRLILDMFRRDVDAAFPGRYVWLESESLHCTLRSLSCTTHTE